MCGCKCGCVDVYVCSNGVCVRNRLAHFSYFIVRPISFLVCLELLSDQTEGGGGHTLSQQMQMDREHMSRKDPSIVLMEGQMEAGHIQQDKLLLKQLLEERTTEGNARATLEQQHAVVVQSLSSVRDELNKARAEVTILTQEKAHLQVKVKSLEEEKSKVCSYT